MADAPEEADIDEQTDEDDEGVRRRRLAGRTLVLFIILPALLIGASGTAFYIFDPLDMFSGDAMDTTEGAERKPVVFFEMPEMLVNLSNQGKRSQYLKITVALEMSDRETKAALQPLLPRIEDIFQVYLRELRAEDLEGSAGVYRLKEELLRRINLVLNPRKIERILFKEMIVQ